MISKEKEKLRTFNNGSLARGAVGKITLAEWRVIQSAGKCSYCDSTGKMCIDHKTPIGRGGSHTAENLQLLCRKCNSEKSSKTDAEYRAHRERIEEMKLSDELKADAKWLAGVLIQHHPRGETLKLPLAIEANSPVLASRFRHALTSVDLSDLSEQDRLRLTDTLEALDAHFGEERGPGKPSLSAGEETVTFGVPMPLSLREWVKEQGGASYIRSLVEADRKARGIK